MLFLRDISPNILCVLLCCGVFRVNEHVVCVCVGDSGSTVIKAVSVWMTVGVDDTCPNGVLEIMTRTACNSCFRIY